MFERIIEVEPHHLSARRHQRVSSFVAQLEHAPDHIFFLGLESAVGGALLDQIFDFVLGDGVVLLVDGRAGEHHYERGHFFEREGDRSHEERDTAEALMMIEQKFFGCVSSDGFRNEDADGEHHDCDDAEGNDQGDRPLELHIAQHGENDRREHKRQEAGDHARERDSDLGGGE